MSDKDTKKIRGQLNALRDFGNSKAVRVLRKELQVKLKKLESRPGRVRQAKRPVSRREIQRQANLSRSSKLKKYHNYLRQIRNSFPDLTYSQIRKQYKARKKGKDVKIPDAVWFNPSP